ncbi:MAG TPA: TonB-dependent receptor [Sphingomicrobium sp.]|nr:TonB-dependent receptor [Sphingomicrobium sp.]
MKLCRTFLSSAALFALASPAGAQQAQPVTPPASSEAAPALPDTTAPDMIDELGDEAPIVITGGRLRGSVVGDIPPEDTLDARDVRATGASDINELLDALAPQIGSSQGRGGGRPVMLLNGKRISSFRELRDIPTEAIERVEILPEEVALKYGYRADQKVVNIVLRERFRSTTARVEAGGPTEGGNASAEADVTRLMIQRNGRTQFNLHAEGNSLLTESERDILLDQPSPTGNEADALRARSLIGTKRDIRGSATVNRTIFGDVGATVNAELEHNEGRSLNGLGDILLEPLARNTNTNTAHLGTTLNGNKGGWNWDVTGNADWERSLTDTERDNFQFPRDHARETSTSGDLTATANGNLFKLPAGDASTTLRVGATTVDLDTSREIAGASNRNSLGRTSGTAAINVDLPISRRKRDFSALGNLTLNGNAEVDQLSDFGTLTKLGAGVNWSPVDRLNFVTSWTREEGPPTIDQLGDPVLETPESRIFDFTTGQTVLVTAITGGNPDLLADKRTVLKLGTYWQPFEDTDLRIRADYVHQHIDRPISNVTVTPTIEAAFPDRFVRDSSGELVSVDLRPLNFDSSRNDTLRIGFDFSKPLKSHQPSQATIDQMRAQFRRGRGAPERSTTAPAGQGSATAPQGQQSAAQGTAATPNGRAAESASSQQESRRGGFGRRGGRGGRFFGGRDRGRINFSLTDTITFVDKVTIAPGFPDLDFLNGDASGQSGGTPRHVVEARAGYFNNGLGARLSANWRSGTRVDTLTGDNLHFSPLATFDLRLFANPGDIPEMVVKHPWLRGTQVRFQIDNIFNARPKVHDAFGNVPLNFQPDLLDPLGRTIMISFRKLFLPSPGTFRRLRDQERQQSGSTR